MSAVCPECEAGKHANCDGQALDLSNDEIVRCQCPTCGADPRCVCGERAIEHGPLGGLGAGSSVHGVRQIPATGVCGRPRWQVYAEQQTRPIRCETVVETARFTWSCLRAPHEQQPDEHVMAVAL